MVAKIFEQVKYGRMTSIRCYIRDGGDIEAVDVLGNTLLIVATEYGKTQVAKLLLSAGANVNAKGFKDYSPLNMLLAG